MPSRSSSAAGSESGTLRAISAAVFAGTGLVPVLIRNRLYAAWPHPQVAAAGGLARGCDTRRTLVNHGDTALEGEYAVALHGRQGRLGFEHGLPLDGHHDPLDGDARLVDRNAVAADFQRD